VCLDALLAQDYPEDRVELIVAADGCTDTTAEAVTAHYARRARVLTQSAAGAAAARNRGASNARGDLLLFLDDDVIAAPGLVAAHVAAHEDLGALRAVVGPYQLEPPVGGDFLQEALYEFWKGLFDSMAEPDHLVTYQDCVSGNLSMTPVTFRRVNGFSELFPACGIEDYELGVRLLSMGADLRFAPRARARHLETTDLRSSLARNRRGAANVVMLVKLHPAVLSTTRLSEPDSRAKRLAFGRVAVGATWAWLAEAWLRCLQALGARKSWRELYAQLKRYSYWRGVRDEVSSSSGLAALLAETAVAANASPAGAEKATVRRARAADAR
jgi:glycosyltransferase involved in cell wall biosynthesis